MQPERKEPVRSFMPLCIYSQSEHLAANKVLKCPLGLTVSEHDYCPCTQRRSVHHGRLTLRVLACLFPVTYTNQQIRNAEAFGQSVARRAREQMAEERTSERASRPDKDQKEDEQDMAGSSLGKPPEPTPPGGWPHKPIHKAALWPQPIPIIGGTGEYASGKTLFGLSIRPADTLVYDMEKSSESYAALGFQRVDVPGEMLRRYSGGYKPIQVFEWWRDHVRSLPAGRYKVIMLDPASEIETGLTDWVRANPGYFSRSAAQYVKMSGLLWGDMKELWKAILADLASRCETFYFTVHMGDVWAGDKPTGKRKPKGKSTLMELASLFLAFERKADPKGNVPAKPAALVLKSRLAHTSIVKGEVVVRPALPPRLPVATPAAISEYLLSPPDYQQLQAGELAPEITLSDDERLQLRAAAAADEAEAARLRLEEADRKTVVKPRAAVATTQATTQAQVATTQAPAPVAVQPAAETLLAPAPAPAVQPNGNGQVHKATPEQLEQLSGLCSQLWADAPEDVFREAWGAILAKRGVTTARDLSPKQADELIVAMRHQLQVAEFEQAFEEGAPAGASGGGD